MLTFLTYSLFVFLFLSCVGAAIAADPASQPAASGPHPVGFMKGFSWGFPGVRGDFIHPGADGSLRRLRATGADWVAICFSGHMTRLDSSPIKWGTADSTMATDDEIRQAVAAARRHGFKVLLKPMVDIRTGEWRGQIEFSNPQDWDRWWQDYQQFMLHYAALAAETHCDILALGCEMISTERFESQWRELIAGVRKVYSGPLTYNANHGGLRNIAWWDAVDLISVSAYYPVGNGPGSTVEEMQKSWDPVKTELKAVSEKYHKPVFFLELGMMSIRGNSRSPARWENKDDPFDGEEQARYYEAALRAFWDEPWFRGYFWWKWDAVLDRPEASSRNTAREVVVGEKGFRIVGKPAEAVLRQWYAKEKAAP